MQTRRGISTPGRAVTLMETLLVVAAVGLLASVLLPGISALRSRAQSVACRSNLHQIVLANQLYAPEHGGVFCPGAADFKKNLNRWHGQRSKTSEAFVSTRAPLAPYLGADRSIRQCPTFPADEIAKEKNGGFEKGCGGYGYNNAFVGVQSARKASGEYLLLDDRWGAWADRIRRPPDTVMFTDSAFASKQLIEYSFAEPRFHPSYPKSRMDPSIHFRHYGTANIAWCDGHIDAERRTLTWSSGVYKADPERLGIGWFGAADDNGFFDLQ